MLTCGGEHTFLPVIYEWLQVQMWICRRWQPEGRQTLVYQREELKGAAPGRLDIFTSIAPCGRHFKGTSSLKTRAWTFMCSRIYTPHCLCFMWFGSWCEVAARTVLFFARRNLGSSLLCTLSVPEDCLFSVVVFRCGSRIAEPNGERESVLARCSRSGHTSLLRTSCPSWLGLKTMHR